MGAISSPQWYCAMGIIFVTTLFGLLLEMMTGRPGPGALLVPRDVFEHRVSAEDLDQLLQWIRGPWARRLGGGPSLSQSALLRFMDTLSRASKPIVVAGPGIHGENGREKLVQFATRHQLPVCTTIADINAFPRRTRCIWESLARQDTFRPRGGGESGCGDCPGCQLEAMQAGPVLPALQRKKLLVVDPGSASTGRLGDVVQWLKTTPSRGIAELENGCPPSCLVGWTTAIMWSAIFRYPSKRMDVRMTHSFQSDAIARIETIPPQRGAVMFDAGNCSAASLHYLNPADHLRSIIALGMGGGNGVCDIRLDRSAIGSTRGRRPHNGIVRDGAFLMEGMEVHTAVELGLPILFVVFNNGGHGMCTTRQRTFFEGREECARYGAVDIQQTARGLGTESDLWVGQASTPGELQEQLQRFSQWNWKGPAVLELVLRAEEQPPFVLLWPQNTLRFRTPRAQHQSPAQPSA